MQKILSFKSPAGHYDADTCVVWCFDDRFSGLLRKFTKHLKNFDLIKVAGGARALAGEASAERDFVLDQIKISIRLHHAKRIALMFHRDCGAYGGSKNFSDENAEREYFENQLSVAKNFLNKEAPGILVETYFAEFDGLYGQK